MPTLRSGTEVSCEDRRPARRHPPRAPTNPNASRDVRYLRQARTSQRANGNSAGTLRQKRRWLNNEHRAGRISGKARRELIDFYGKKNIGKPKSRLPKVRSLTNDAKSVKRRLDELFIQRPDGSLSAGAMVESHGNAAGDAGEGPSITVNHLEDPHSNGHQTVGETIDGRVPDEPPHEGAVDTVAGADIKPEDKTDAEDDTEMEDESSTEEEDLSNRTGRARVAPVNSARANDAAARQRILELGLQLADRGFAEQDAQMRLGDMDEVEIKREEEGSE